MKSKTDDLPALTIRAQTLLKSKLSPIILQEIQKNTHNKLHDRFQITPVFDDASWELITTERFKWTAFGKAPEPHTEMITGGSCYFQVTFMPENYAPKAARILVTWEDGRLEWPTYRWKEILEKYLCYVCEGISGLSCTCQPPVETIAIGQIERDFSQKLQDVESALRGMKIKAGEAKNIVEALREEATGEETLEQLVTMALKSRK